jgi:phosphate:Na+ symporter
MRAQFIDSRVLNTPPIALGQARRETNRMAGITLEMLEDTNLFIESGELRKIKELESREGLVDLLQKEITDFLVALSQKSVSARTSREIAMLMHIVNDLEQIADHCENLWKLGQRKIEANITFSEIGLNELAEISTRTEEFLQFVVSGLAEGALPNDTAAMNQEDIIEALEKGSRDNHINRLNTGECAVDPGIIFIDLLHNYKKISDHCYNISESLVEHQE